MDYKTNILPQALKADSDLLPEFNGLHFAILDQRRALFDFTAYVEENKLSISDHRAFMRTCRSFIEVLANNAGRSTSELFYQNTDGHILISAELVFICMAFVNPEMCIYFDELLTDAISDGVAFSHGFIVSLVSEKLPSEVLSDIVKEREKDAAENEQ